MENDRVWEALANKTRRKIMDLLKQGKKSTGELCLKFPKLSRCTVMLHLDVLEEAGLLIVKREGRYRWNYLNIAPIQRIYNRWLDQYAQPSAAFMLKVKDDLEKGA